MALPSFLSRLGKSVGSTSDALSRIGKPLGNVAALAGAGMALYGLARSVGLSLKERANEKQVTSELLEEHPDWKPKTVDRIMQMIGAYAPEYMKSKFALKSLVKQLMTYGGVAPETIRLLTDIHQKSQDPSLTRSITSFGLTSLSSVPRGRPKQ